MKKIVILLFIVLSLTLTSCSIKPEQVDPVNETKTYSLNENLNIDVETGYIKLVANTKDLEPDTIRITYKYNIEFNEDGNTSTLTSIKRVFNYIVLEINESNTQLNNINVTSGSSGVECNDISFNTLNVKAKELTTFSTSYITSKKICVDAVLNTYQTTIYQSKIDNLNVVYNESNKTIIQNSTFDIVNIDIIKSDTEFWENKFNKATIKQDTKKINGSFLREYGYTLNCKAKNLNTDDMDAENNIYKNGECEINFSCANGEVSIWLH